MLAQNFKTAAELGLADVEVGALITVLGMLERGEIDDSHFDMLNFIKREACGTVGCLCGWAYEVSGHKAFPEVASPWWAAEFLSKRLPGEANRLFMLNLADAQFAWRAKPTNAALALRSYLTTGEPRWAEALA